MRVWSSRIPRPGYPQAWPSLLRDSSDAASFGLSCPGGGGIHLPGPVSARTCTLSTCWVQARSQPCEDSKVATRCQVMSPWPPRGDRPGGLPAPSSPPCPRLPQGAVQWGPASFSRLFLLDLLLPCCALIPFIRHSFTHLLPWRVFIEHLLYTRHSAGNGDRT